MYESELDSDVYVSGKEERAGKCTLYGIGGYYFTRPSIPTPPPISLSP